MATTMDQALHAVRLTETPTPDPMSWDATRTDASPIPTVAAATLPADPVVKKGATQPPVSHLPSQLTLP